MKLANELLDGTLLTNADLAAMADFTLGGVIVSPSTRALRGPAGTEDVEPRVMQVLVVLAAAAGQVVTRETLFTRCWGGVYVGDDSLNRAIAAVRRAGEAVGGRFEVETIPRTGYRLVVPKGDAGEDSGRRDGHRVRWSRRGALIATGAAALGGIGLWSVRNRKPADPRFDRLMANSEKAVRTEAISPQTAQQLTHAVALRPDSAKAWGLLAFVRSLLVQGASPEAVPGAVATAQDAARQALALDPKEPNALLAMFELQGSTLDWATRDQRLRQVLAVDPHNLGAISELVLLLQAVGLNRESWDWNERSLALEPLVQGPLCRRAMKLWIAGRVPEADKVIDQVRGLWPSAPAPFWVRFLILALSGRPRAALAMIDGKPEMLGPPEGNELWRTSLTALDRPSPDNIARARHTCSEAARIAGQFAGQGVMILSALGDVDGAFAIANGFLLSRGSIVRRREPGHKPDLNDAGWRINTQWLFTPPAAAMRADPRFLPLCEGVGLVEYWRHRGVRPDYQLARR